MNVFEQIAVKIIKSQETIIGPVAIEQAGRVPNLKVNWGKDAQEVTIAGEASKVLDTLIQVYKELFGQISVEVSKEAAASLVGQLPAGQLPEALK